MAQLALPLRATTPAQWATRALIDTPALLNDHAHLERKAATNALGLISHCPNASIRTEWNSKLLHIIQDEVQHMAQVHKLLLKHKHTISLNHKNPYTTALHKLLRKGYGPHEHIDRLLISAIIEARSCERFRLLMEAPSTPDLQRFYLSLSASEHGHFQIFLDLAYLIGDKTEILKRWEWILDQEATIIRQQPCGSRIHSGWLTP